MEAAAPETRTVQTLALRIVRLGGGLLVGSVLGAVVFLAIEHQGVQRGATDLRFVRSLGVLRGFTGADVPREGLWTALAAAVVLSLVVLVPAHFLIRQWWLRAVPLAALTYLAWALIYAPRATFPAEIENAAGEIERTRIDVGFLGTDAGNLTPIVFLVAAVGGALVAARVSDLMAGEDFWQPKDNDIRRGLDELAELGLAERDGTAGAASLELGEQRRPEPDQARGGDS